MFMFTFTEEEDITFPPTYRFERDTHEKYVYTKAKATGVLIFVVIDFQTVKKQSIDFTKYRFSSVQPDIMPYSTF